MIEHSHHNISTTDFSEITKTILLPKSSNYQKMYSDLIIDLEKFEKTTAIKGHRDHLGHSSRVWGMGLILYKRWGSPFFNNQGLDDNLFDFVWCLTTLYHDVGYVKASKEVGKKHGECGAELFERKLIENFPNKDWNKEVKYAINAIKLHDKCDRVEIEKDPTSALLIICDELQEWGRKIHKEDKRPEINKLQFCISKKTEKEMKIKLIYPKSRKKVKKLISDIGKMEGKLNEKFSCRIKNFKIRVECCIEETS